MEMKQMERLGQQQTRVGNHNLAQNNCLLSTLFLVSDHSSRAHRNSQSLHVRPDPALHWLWLCQVYNNRRNRQNPTHTTDSTLTTQWAIKRCHFYFYNNIGKCGPISIILSVLDSYINCGIQQNKIFHHTWIMLPHYLVKFKCFMAHDVD